MRKGYSVDLVFAKLGGFQRDHRIKEGQPMAGPFYIDEVNELTSLLHGVF